MTDKAPILSTIERGTVALVNEMSDVVAASTFRVDDPADFQRAWGFTTDGIQISDRAVIYRLGEVVTIGKPAPLHGSSGSSTDQNDRSNLITECIEPADIVCQHTGVCPDCTEQNDRSNQEER